MNKLAFIFPGQGSQFVGMGKALCDHYPEAREIFERADAALGFDLTGYIFNGPADVLNSTEYTQPALMAASFAAFRVFNKHFDIEPSFVAGHSLGEYTALAVAGALDFEDALKVVHKRGKFMQESSPQGAGLMCAVLGAPVDTVIDICKEVSTLDNVAVAANINTSEQVVISGHIEAVQRAAELAKLRGARRVVPLSVSVPSHSPLMAGAADKLSSALIRVELRDPSVPLISNVEARPVADAAAIIMLLRRQLTKPVKWVDIVLRLKKEGVRAVVEIGPGRVLSGLVRRIDKGMDTYNFGEPGDMETLKPLVTTGPS